MPMFKTCTACKETFIAESPFIKLCPICNAKSQTTPAERAQRKTRITPDRLMLDVRQADATLIFTLTPITVAHSLFRTAAPPSMTRTIPATPTP